MNCTEFTNILTSSFVENGEFVLDELSAVQQANFEAHRTSCGACQALCVAELEAEVALLSALQEMPVPAPSAGFADRALQAAVVQNGTHDAGQHQRHGFMVGFGSAAVAAVAIWVVVGMFPGAMPPGDGVSDEVIAKAQPVAEDVKVPTLSIALNQQQDVKLAFHSSESLKGAKITIRLPENVALVGYPGRRELSWTTNLKKGDNLLRLPVIATQIARGDLVADIVYQDRVRTLTLSLEAHATDALKQKIIPFVG